MALFDLRKRRTKSKETPDAAAAAISVVPAVPQHLAGAVNDPAETALALGDGPLPPAPPIEWRPELQDLAFELLGRNHDVLMLGLAPWGTSHWPQRLLGRVRGVVAVDPDKARLVAVRSYCHKTVESSLDGLEWLARLGGQRFGTAFLGDALTHLVDPIAFLRRVRETLAGDGQLVGIVPNAAWGESRLELLQGELKRDVAPGGALHRYNQDRLREVLALSGFALIEVQPWRTPLFEAESTLVPELFPEAVMQVLGPPPDATISHLVFRAQPASAEALLRGMFDEQELLRKVVRNELARANRTHDALTQRLKEADYVRGGLENELEEYKRKLAGLAEMAARADQNIRRLGKEADDAQRELRALKESWVYRLMRWFGPAPRGGVDASPGPTEWKVEEPKSRYL